MFEKLHIRDSEFRKLRDLVYNNFGISLSDIKKGLVVSRLQKILRQYSFKDFTEYYDFISNDKSGKGLNELVNKITTNYSYFYREPEHYNYLTKTVLPYFCNLYRSERDIRVWSAGCSSGEEAYMLGMILMETLGDEYYLWKAGVLATDISEEVLAMAKKGIYPKERMNKLPKLLLNKYFHKLDNDKFIVTDLLKKEMTFRRLNLVAKKFPFSKKFHIIFCRNVMIYFDDNSRVELSMRFADSLVSGGYLFLGHSETLGREQSLFDYIMPAVFRKK